MTTPLSGLLADARQVPAPDRARLVARLRTDPLPGALVLETCHRVELYAPSEVVGTLAGEPEAAGARLVDDAALTRHVVTLAVGRASAVLGEDQVLHQLREAVRVARERGPLPVALDRLLDRALHAGRLARSWLPAHRPSLADVALDAAVEASGRSGPPGAVMVVGAGRMGLLGARAARARGHAVLVASRTTESAARVARATGASVAPFLPSDADVARVDGVLVALSGPWPVPDSVAGALAGAGAWVVDLSSPAAVPSSVPRLLGNRFLSVDDLAARPASAAPEIAARLDRLIEATVDEHERWRAAEPQRHAARALVDRADRLRDAELEALWERMPSLDPTERAAVARMADRLASRLLHDPLERLSTDGDGRHGRAARELFGL